MKTIILLLLFSSAIQAQDSFNKYIKLGPHGAGFCDSVIYNQDERYAQFSYEGKAPLFLQIWHPVQNDSSKKRLSLKEIRNASIPDPLIMVYDTLRKLMDKSFIDYNIKNDFVNYEPLDYTPFSVRDVLHSIHDYRTNSVAARLEKGSDAPIILYHHGAQGLSDENFAMAEYFASRGYIFISANYHLPFEGMIYGNASGIVDASSFPKTVTKFARQLTTSNKLYYIGHSWGAQDGFKYLHEDGWASAFISLETTIEFKDDTNKIKEYWPLIYDLIARRKTTYPMPMLLVANTGEDKPFDYFKNIGEQDVYFATAQAEFGHESYTAAFHMRFLYNELYPQPDSLEMLDQMQLYELHLKLIEAFIGSTQSNEALNTDEFADKFFINKE